MIKFNYSNHYIDVKDKRNVLKALSSKALTKGGYLTQFESRIKKFVNSKYCVAVSNASNALISVLRSLDIYKNDNIWCSNNTYIATINCALHLNLNIDLVDIDLKDYNISVECLEKKLFNCQKKKLPRYLIITHIGGYSCNIKKIYQLSKKYNFKIIEDASHALGAKYLGNKIGNCKYSEATIFSFHPSKVITSAEGGAITTNNKRIYEKLKLIRENGHDFSKNKFHDIDINYYDVKELGYNFRLNELSCALGIAQLDKINKFISYKDKLSKNYFLKLNKKKFILPLYNFSNRYTSWHLFIVRINFKNLKSSKNEILKFLKKKGIIVKTHYPPLSTLTIINKNKKMNYPKSMEYYKSAISIPLYYDLKLKDQKKIIKILNKI
jgi:dTDP-4-amino-4,6-dideoxygalactose transaminase